VHRARDGGPLCEFLNKARLAVATDKNVPVANHFVQGIEGTTLGAGSRFHRSFSFLEKCVTLLP
jgi:hypothetical protein